MKSMFKHLLSVGVATVTLSTVAVFSPEVANAISFNVAPVGSASTTNPNALTIDFGDAVEDLDINDAGIPFDDTVLKELAEDVEIRGSLKTGGRPTGSTGRFLVAEESGVAEFIFSQKLNYFGLLWGSINRGNVISFYDGNNFIQSFSGTNLFGKGTPAITGGSTRFINFFVDEVSENNYDFFDRVVISGGGDDPFQLDNVAYEVIPTPALLPGLIGLGMAALRKRKQEESSAEA